MLGTGNSNVVCFTVFGVNLLSVWRWYKANVDKMHWCPYYKSIYVQHLFNCRRRIPLQHPSLPRSQQIPQNGYCQCPSLATEPLVMAARSRTIEDKRESQPPWRACHRCCLRPSEQWTTVSASTYCRAASGQCRSRALNTTQPTDQSCCQHWHSTTTGDSYQCCDISHRESPYCLH